LIVYGNDNILELSDGMKYIEEPPYWSEEVNLEDGSVARLLFVNTYFDLCEVSLTKTVTGSTNEKDLDTLFPFTLYFIREFEGQLYSEAFPLTDDPLAMYGQVSGLPAGRIRNDAAGNPTILMLKHGESVTISKLFHGTYVLRELDVPSLSYSVESIVDGTEFNSGNDVFIFLPDNSDVEFINTLENIPHTGDGVRVGLFTLFLTSGAFSLYLYMKDRRKKQNGR